MFQNNQQIGPYTLVRLLGRGGFGEVWLAEKRSSLLTTQFALKLSLDPDPDLDAIKKEAVTWLHASGHPNVLPVIEAEVYDGQVVIVSEYAAGGSLNDWLKRNGGKAPSVEAAVTMTAGILAGLEYLHSRQPQPIIHRDLKPDNVLLQHNIPRLTDFGISRVLKTTGHTNSASGTPSYMPPEAFAGNYSTRSDLWAVGVILYQMLSGRKPFPQNDLPSLYGAIHQRNPDPLPPDVPETLKSVVAKALAKEPVNRFESAQAMQIALESNPTVTPPVQKVAPSPTPPRNRVNTAPPIRPPQAVPAAPTITDLPIDPAFGQKQHIIGNLSGIIGRATLSGETGLGNKSGFGNFVKWITTSTMRGRHEPTTTILSQ